MKYKHLFGPVPSRRLGMSLGVDLVPKKVCSLDCVYCEVGRTTDLTVKRDEYVPYDEVVKELKNYFENNQEPDFITFSGSGEPTLNSRIGDVIKFIKNLKPSLSVAVLTNGTLLSDKNVRDELMDADLVLPSLDAVTEKSFNKINRPSPKLDIDEYIQGLIDFSNEFKGKIWLEVFILPRYNYDEEEFLKFKNIIEEIKPDSVQLNTLDRPGTVENLQPADEGQLKKFIEITGFNNIEIIASTPNRKKAISYRNDIESIILGTIDRRPCTVEDLSEILNLHISELNKYLSILEAERKIKTVKLKRGVFYQKIGG